MSQPIRILLNGAKGRMGLAIVNVAASEKAVIAAGVDQGDNLAAHIGAADVVIDFSFHSATLAVAQLCAQHKKPLVIGTTGHTAEEKAAITAAIKGLPVVWAGNYSVGVTLLNALVRQAARSLADAGRWDVEVLEMHHRLKKDAPSGTAETLLKILLEERRLAKDALKHGRDGLVGERPLDNGPVWRRCRDDLGSRRRDARSQGHRRGRSGGHRSRRWGGHGRSSKKPK